MYISTKDWKNYIDRLSALDEKAGELMKEWISRHGFSDTKAMTDYAYALAQKYGEGSAALSAEMYDAVAEMQGKLYAPAEAMPPPDYGEVAKTVNGILKHSQNPNSIANGVSRLVKRTGADTTLKNALRDGAEFAWVPNGDTCAFCIMLASRGWQRISKKALKNGHAEHIHPNCDCTYAVRFDGKSNVKGYDPDKYLDMYYGADGSTPMSRVNAIRRMQYAEHPEKYRAQKREAYEIRKSLTIGTGNDMLPSEKYDMPASKIKDFLLKPGAKHSREFFDVGYTTEDTGKLNADINNQYDEKNAEDRRVLPDGAQRFSIKMDLGVSTTKPFKTVWQKEPGSDKARFITAYRVREDNV